MLAYLNHEQVTSDYADILISASSVSSTATPSGLNNGACNKALHLSATNTGTIYSPGFDLQGGNYPPKTKCDYTLYAPTGYTIKLHFNAFGLEGGRNCPYDSLKVYDGASKSGTELGNFCGHQIPGTINSKGNIMFAEFTSDESNEGIGFNATYTVEKYTGTSNKIFAI